jgi:hypothetical protein
MEQGPGARTSNHELRSMNHELRTMNYSEVEKLNIVFREYLALGWYSLNSFGRDGCLRLDD